MPERAAGRRGASRAERHLRGCDPVMARLLERVGPIDLHDRRGRPDDHYGALVRSIVGQQLSTKAARSIYARLVEHFDGHTPTPAEVLAADPEAMRAAAGLSRPKVSFLRSLAEHVTSGELDLERLDALPDEQVIAELVAIKGIGTWTAHMFLMFHLERPDVLATGDLGIRHAVRIEYGLDADPEPHEIEPIAAPWSPFRTVACRYLWASLDNEPAV